ncbi:hypothetical protein VDG1235_3194 [Verrucomicrobiia bacterium DG1235]|nr:hypothetical protein VDG1235_3194 [Verrucomicrobiae bacterium DG1235]
MISNPLKTNSSNLRFTYRPESAFSLRQHHSPDASKSHRFHVQANETLIPIKKIAPFD